MTDQTDLFSRPVPVPYAKNSDTSRAAADSVRQCRGEMERKVYGAFVAAGARGLTTDEAEVVTGMSHQSCSARVNALADRDLLVLTDERRPTRSKRMAGVYRVPR